MVYRDKPIEESTTINLCLSIFDYVVLALSSWSVLPKGQIMTNFARKPYNSFIRRSML